MGTGNFSRGICACTAFLSRFVLRSSKTACVFFSWIGTTFTWSEVVRRETKVASIIQTQMITFSWWIETEEYEKGFFLERTFPNYHSQVKFLLSLILVEDHMKWSALLAGINTVRHLHKGHFLDLMGPKSPSVPTLQITSKVFGSIPQENLVVQRQQ